MEGRTTTLRLLLLREKGGKAWVVFPWCKQPLRVKLNELTVKEEMAADNLLWLNIWPAPERANERTCLFWSYLGTSIWLTSSPSPPPSLSHSLRLENITQCARRKEAHQALRNPRRWYWIWGGWTDKNTRSRWESSKVMKKYKGNGSSSSQLKRKKKVERGIWK